MSSFTIAQLEAIESAIADGALKVKYSDKEVEYRSLSEMLKIRDLMAKALGVSGSKKEGKGLFGGRRLKIEHSKGLN